MVARFNPYGTRELHGSGSQNYPYTSVQSRFDTSYNVSSSSVINKREYGPEARLALILPLPPMKL